MNHFLERLRRTARVAFHGPRAARRWQGWTILLLSLASLSAHGGAPKELQVKAAFVYNFTKFVEWPAGQFPSADAPIVIGVFAGHPSLAELEDVVRERKVNARPLHVVPVRNPDDLRNLHVLYVGADDEPAFRRVAAAAPASVLTIGDGRGDAAGGCIITFKTEKDKVRFEIDMDRAEEAGLKISAQLQKLATAVRRKP